MKTESVQLSTPEIENDLCSARPTLVSVSMIAFGTILIYCAFPSSAMSLEVKQKLAPSFLVIVNVSRVLSQALTTISCIRVRFIQNLIIYVALGCRPALNSL